MLKNKNKNKNLCCPGSDDSGKVDRNHVYFKSTISMCNKCEALVKAKVLIKSNKVYFKKECPDCGITENMVSSDAELYMKAYHYNKPGTIPLHFNKERKIGCPNDCGICNEHEQHTCQPVIDVSDKCNMDCPICIADCKGSYQYTPEQFKKIIDNLIRCEGKLPLVVMAGGEPSIHPNVFDFVKIAKDTGKIERVGINTNGLKIAEDINFVKRIKDENMYVFLQYDGTKEETYVKLRGKNYYPMKMKALENLEKYNIPTTLITTVVKGINDDDIGNVVKLVLLKDHLLGMTFQPAAHVGKGGSHFDMDPMDIMTRDCVVSAIEEQTKGLISKSDIIPVPCSHPQCFSLSYLLKHKDGTITPFARMMNLDQYLDLITNKAVLTASDKKVSESFEKMIYDLWSGDANVPISEKITATMKQLFNKLYPSDSNITNKERILIADYSVKTLFIHHFMDKYTFDLERVQKCCNHYPQADDRLMPMCTFNNFYRNQPGGHRTTKIPVKL
ncbi:MAG: radical SAM protein [Oligoflexia bacterium]|nr:radical SAM protein [Oligoflexia bacterium]